MWDMLLGGWAGLFTATAAIGTIFFAVRLVMLLIGSAADLNADAGAFDDVGLDAEHASPNDGFKVLSIQAVGAFLMGFGWGGLGALRGTGLDLGPSMFVAAASGIGMVWLLGAILKAIHRLQASGNIRAQDAVGRDATVYVRVLPGGRPGGKVAVTVDNHLRYFDAVSTDAEPIARGTKVRLVSLNEDRSFTVARA